MSDASLTGGAWTDKGTGNVPLTDLSKPVEAPVDNTSTGAVPGPPTSVTYTCGIPGLVNAADQQVEQVAAEQPVTEANAAPDVIPADEKPARRAKRS